MKCSDLVYSLHLSIVVVEPLVPASTVLLSTGVCSSMPPKEKKGKKKKVVDVAEPPHDPTWERVSFQQQQMPAC